MSATSRRCFHAGTREDSKWVARDPRVWPWRWLAVWLSGSFRLRTSIMAVEDGKAVMQRLGSQSASAAERQRGRRYGDCCTTLGAGTSGTKREVTYPTHTGTGIGTPKQGKRSSGVVGGRQRHGQHHPSARGEGFTGSEWSGSGAILGLSKRAFLTTGLVARCKGECGDRAVDTAEGCVVCVRVCGRATRQTGCFGQHSADGARKKGLVEGGR